MGHYASEIGPNDDFLQGKATEPTPKPTDALELLKRWRHDGPEYGPAHDEVMDAAIAAWEKERAETLDMVARQEMRETQQAADIYALRAALERIEGEMRGYARNGFPKVYDRTTGRSWTDFQKVREWADALRAAREPNRPQGEG